MTKAACAFADLRRALGQEPKGARRTRLLALVIAVEVRSAGRELVVLVELERTPGCTAFDLL